LLSCFFKSHSSEVLKTGQKAKTEEKVKNQEMEEKVGDSFQAINKGEVEQRYKSIFTKN